jgi:hypothetical protein
VIRLPSRSLLKVFHVRRSVRASALLLLAAVPIAAQDPDQPFARLDQTSRFAIEALLDSAKNMGLPAGALRSLGLEGMVKTKGDGRRIVAAMKEQFARFKTVQAILGNVGDQEIVAAADVLKAGAKPTQLQVFRERQQGRTDLEAFTVWTDLISRGVPSEDAFSAIGKLWRDGADDATFRSLWKDVQADISQGLNPGAALQNRIREAPGRAPPKPTQPEGQKENQSSR